MSKNERFRFYGCGCLFFVAIAAYGVAIREEEIAERKKHSEEIRGLETTTERMENPIDVNGDGLKDILYIDSRGERKVLYAHKLDDGSIGYFPQEPITPVEDRK
jgi:hypothetical protein